MSIFKKILNLTSKSQEDENDKHKHESKFMPEEKLPADESFMKNFKENGGKFLYCSNLDDVLQTFQKILEENSWENTSVYCKDENLKNIFKDFDVEFTPHRNSTFFLTTCEYLIGSTGALLISSNQIGEKKLADLPHNFVVYAGTSQLIENISDGLRGIKNKYQGKIPTNITTIKTFEDNIDDDNFMSYGSTSKNLYLLLLEDL